MAQQTKINSQSRNMERSRSVANRKRKTNGADRLACTIIKAKVGIRYASNNRSETDSYECHLCDAFFNNILEAFDHVISLVHHLKLDNDPFYSCSHYCFSCKKSIGRIANYVQHIESAKHRRLVLVIRKTVERVLEQCATENNGKTNNKAIILELSSSSEGDMSATVDTCDDKGLPSPDKRGNGQQGDRVFSSGKREDNRDAPLRFTGPEAFHPPQGSGEQRFCEKDFSHQNGHPYNGPQFDSGPPGFYIDQRPPFWGPPWLRGPPPRHGPPFLRGPPPPQGPFPFQGPSFYHGGPPYNGPRPYGGPNTSCSVSRPPYRVSDQPRSYTRYEGHRYTVDYRSKDSQSSCPSESQGKESAEKRVSEVVSKTPEKPDVKPVKDELDNASVQNDDTNSKTINCDKEGVKIDEPVIRSSTPIDVPSTFSNSRSRSVQRLSRMDSVVDLDGHSGSNNKTNGCNSVDSNASKTKTTVKSTSSSSTSNKNNKQSSLGTGHKLNTSGETNKTSKPNEGEAHSKQQQTSEPISSGPSKSNVSPIVIHSENSNTSKENGLVIIAATASNVEKPSAQRTRRDTDQSASSDASDDQGSKVIKRRSSTTTAGGSSKSVVVAANKLPPAKTSEAYKKELALKLANLPNSRKLDNQLAKLASTATRNTQKKPDWPKMNDTADIIAQVEAGYLSEDVLEQIMAAVDIEEVVEPIGVLQEEALLFGDDEFDVVNLSPTDKANNHDQQTRSMEVDSGVQQDVPFDGVVIKLEPPDSGDVVIKREVTTPLPIEPHELNLHSNVNAPLDGSSTATKATTATESMRQSSMENNNNNNYSNDNQQKHQQQNNNIINNNNCRVGAVSEGGGGVSAALLELVQLSKEDQRIQDDLDSLHRSIQSLQMQLQEAHGRRERLVHELTRIKERRRVCLEKVSGDPSLGEAATSTVTQSTSGGNSCRPQQSQQLLHPVFQAPSSVQHPWAAPPPPGTLPSRLADTEIQPPNSPTSSTSSTSNVSPTVGSSKVVGVKRVRKAGSSCEQSPTVPRKRRSKNASTAVAADSSPAATTCPTVRTPSRGSSIPALKCDDGFVEFEAHKAAITQVKIYENFLYTCATDGFARRFDLSLSPNLSSPTNEYPHQYDAESYVSEAPSILECRQQHTDGATIRRPTVTCMVVAVTRLPTSIHLYTGAQDGILRAFDVDTCECKLSKNLANSITCCVTAWMRLYIGLASGGICVYSIKFQKMLDTFSGLSAQPSIANLITTTEGGQKLLCSIAQDGTTAVRDAISGVMYRIVEDRGCSLTRALAVRDGLVLTATTDNYIQLHELSRLEPCQWYYGAGGEQLLTMDNCEKMVCTANRKGMVRIFSLNPQASYVCQQPSCSLRFGRQDDLVHHQTVKHGLSPMQRSCSAVKSTNTAPTAARPERNSSVRRNVPLRWSRELTKS